MKVLGKGRQGIVFLHGRRALKIVPFDIQASTRREIQPADVEFNIQSKIQKVAPSGVVRVYKLIKRTNFVPVNRINMPNVQNTNKYNKSRQTLIYSEYCNGGSLASWLEKQKRISDTTLTKIISQVLKTLYRIHRKYPYFRHNDLHIDNVFVSRTRGALIGDFGWSRLLRNGTNPAVNTANGTSTASYWGVGPRTDARYDMHLFCSGLLKWMRSHKPSRFPKTYAYLHQIIPIGYQKDTDVHTNAGRLKYLDPCPGLPTVAQALRILNFKSKLIQRRRVKSRSKKIRV
jgi:serine/threonine protein kinase